jgi:hypothetical protein
MGAAAPEDALAGGASFMRAAEKARAPVRLEALYYLAEGPGSREGTQALVRDQFAPRELKYC